MITGLAIGACATASLWIAVEYWRGYQKRKADGRWLAAIRQVKPKKKVRRK